MVINLNQFLKVLKAELPEICCDKDLVKHIPEIFRNQTNISRMRARGETPPYIYVKPHIHYLRDDVICWLREKYQTKKMPISHDKKVKSSKRGAGRC